MANPISGAGLGSNLDVTGLVTKLMSAEQGPLNQLTSQASAAEVQITSFATLKSALSTFQGSLSGLENVSMYTSSAASFADPTVASVSLSSGADTGSHTLEVTSLAASQRLKSGTTFNALTDTVGTGTLTFNFGSYDSTSDTVTPNDQHDPQTVTIDTAHSTLSGVRDAINAANIGVNASIVNDGTGYRLVLASSSTGKQNGISISAADDHGNPIASGGLQQFAFDPTTAGVKNMSQVVPPADAQFLMDGIAITKPSNTVSDVLAGTTINLLKTNVGAPTTLTVSQDTSQVQTAVTSFVTAYNTLNSTIKQLTNYDTTTTPGTPIAGPLIGDAAVRSLSQQLKSSLGQIVSGISGGYKALAQIGITSASDGSLTIDSSKLHAALQSSPQSVESLFATNGSADDPQVSYTGSSAATPAGLYQLNVSRLATQSSLVGSSAAANLTIDSSNDALTVSINGVTTSITLDHATYASADALAAQVQSKLNGDSTLKTAGINTTVSASGGTLTLTSNTYGSTSKVALLGGSGQSNLFGSAATAPDGVDVAGTIGGITAIGSGQSLLGTNGLSVNVTGGTTGDRGNIHFTKGVAVQLDQLLSNALGTKGVLTARTDSLNAQVKQITAEETAENARLAAKQAQYTEQFTTLDQLITTMNSTMSYMTQQLSALQSSTSTK